MLLESQYWSARQLLEYQRSQLSQLLEHARKNVPFYQSRLDPVFTWTGKIDWNRWEEIPILTRQDLFDHRDSMLAPAVPLGHGETRDHWSSGTTGVPVTVRHNGLAFWLLAPHWPGPTPGTTLIRQKPVATAPRVAGILPSGRGQAGRHMGAGMGQKGNRARLAHQPSDISGTACTFHAGKTGLPISAARPKTAHAAALEALRLKLPLKLDAILGHGTGITEEEAEDCRRAFGARDHRPLQFN